MTLSEENACRNAFFPNACSFKYFDAVFELFLVLFAILRSWPEINDVEIATQIDWVVPCPCPPGCPGWLCHIIWSTVCLLGRRPFTSDRRHAWISDPTDAWSRSLHRGPDGMG